MSSMILIHALWRPRRTGARGEIHARGLHQLVRIVRAAGGDELAGTSLARRACPTGCRRRRASPPEIEVAYWKT